jgi:plastocyanin
VILRRHYKLATVAVAAALGLAAATTWALPATPDAAQIVIKSFMFTPMELKVKAGATVTWSNMDDEPHSVVSDTGLFRSGAVDTHESYSFKFDKPGTYHFICSLHPQMSGTIVVE